MPAPRKLPDNTTLRQLRAQKWKLKDIAREYGVTEAAVWKALERAGFTDRKETYRDILPWDIDTRHRSTAVTQRIRALMRRNRGVTLSPSEEHLLNTWLQAMENNGVVLDYHPDAPENDASRIGGFFYTPRLPEDGDGFIRMPKEQPKPDLLADPDPEPEPAKTIVIPDDVSEITRLPFSNLT